MNEGLSDATVKRRAKSGIFFVGSWGLLSLIVGFGGNLLLARLLTPEDFGVVAIGATLMLFTTSIADGGLGSGLIRREVPPTRQELKATVAIQLAFTTTLAVIAAAIGIALGGAGLVVALMMTALPIAAFQTPGRVTLSRAVRFKLLSTAEGTATILYYAWAIALVVLAGWDVWALATAVVFRAIILAIGVTVASGSGLLMPSFRGAAALKPVIAFGVRFQGVSLAGMLREQLLNVGIVAIAGVNTLGIWTLTKRLLEFPALMFEPLHRVSFPVLSHVLAAKQDPAKMLDRGVAVASSAAGVVLVTMAAACPGLVPFIFGEQWRAVGEILPWICAALLVAGPLSVVAVGFLYASDAPSVVLKATIWHTLALFAVAFPALHFIGPEGIGMGSLAGAIVDAAIMARAISARSSSRPLEGLLPTIAIAALAGGIGLAISAAGGHDMMSAVEGGAAAAAVYLTLLTLLRRRVVLDTLHLIRGAAASALSKEPALTPVAD